MKCTQNVDLETPRNMVVLEKEWIKFEIRALRYEHEKKLCECIMQ
jgi:hypothetical protein